MKTKKILYLCIAGLIIAMMILSILPIWTITNYPKAKADTTVNTEYNYTQFTENTGIFEFTATESIYYPKFQITPDYKEETIYVEYININIYTNTNANIYYNYIDENNNTNQILINKYTNQNNIEIKKTIKNIYIEIDMSKIIGQKSLIILGEFTVFDGTTTYGFYYPEAKNLLNSLYEDSYNDGYQEAINKEYDPIKLYEWQNLNYSTIFGYNKSLTNGTLKSEIWGNDPEYQGPTNTNIKNSVILISMTEDIQIIEGQEYYINYENTQNIAAIDIGYIYNTSSSGTISTANWRSIKYWNIGQENVLFEWNINPGDVVLNIMGASFCIRFVPINTEQPIQISNITLWTSNANYQAYEKGYSQGYQNGYTAGSSTTISEATGFDIIAIGFKSVFEALDVDIFYGKVSLVDIFNIFFIIMVVTAVLAIIRG